jgi:non-homologous end joining protein Ku
MRPYWKGYLKLALVSCPIALHAACSTAERIAFRQINKATGNRLRQQLIDEETREPVNPENKGRGYFRDGYEEALLAHLKAKQAGIAQEPKPTFVTPRRVINLMEALRRSVDEDKRQVPPRRGRSGNPSAQTGLNVGPRRAASPSAG